MTENPKDYRHGHRERLREKFMAGKLADYELLELLLAYAIPRRDVKPMARELLRLFGNFNNVLCTPVEKLASVPGVGKSAAILIKVTREITLLDCKSVISNTPIFMEY
ncbi:MAG: hypothetical protein FWE17_01870, partial [Alphaproteobacteria bacterium]|nr:hypothetical protein [Alphaproteobacteria bacterium]